MTRRRLLVLAAGYIAASGVAAAIIVIALLAFSTSPGPIALDLGLVRITMIMTAFVTGLVALLALLPFGIAMAYAERHAIAAPGWYMAAGAVAGGVALGLHLAIAAIRDGGSMSAPGDHDVTAALAVMALAVLVAGMSAGLTVWLIAGRYTGRP